MSGIDQSVILACAALGLGAAATKLAGWPLAVLRASGEGGVKKLHVYDHCPFWCVAYYPSQPPNHWNCPVHVPGA